MERSFRLLPLLAALAGGCTTMPGSPANHFEVDQALQSAARQVRRCYRAPRVTSDGRLIITRLRVRLTPEGQLAGLPILLRQTGVTEDNKPYAGRMAEAAIAAVLRCAPLTLPPALYSSGWNEFDLTFSPTFVV